MSAGQRSAMSHILRPCYFLDTSALLKLVLEEPGSERVRSLCDETPCANNR